MAHPAIAKIRNRRFSTAAVALLLLAACAAGDAKQQRPPPRTQVHPLPGRLSYQEEPDRDTWQKPHEVVRALKLRNGEVVADIGAGTGYFARRFTKAVAPDGKVYAVDTDAEALSYLGASADAEGLHDVVTIVSREDDPLLPRGSIDLAFFADTTHHIANRIRFYRRMLPGLKDNARLVIIDYPPGGPHAPHPPEQLVPRAEAIQEAEQAGFKLVEEFRFLPYQYFLVFERS